MSTFQIARDALAWANTFSIEERGGLDFTYDDILPVAGTYRKVLLDAMENIRPVTALQCAQSPHVDPTIALKSELQALTARKNAILQQLKEVDADVSDHDDLLVEEELRADQFYMLLDEETNISQFLKSLLVKAASYVQSPPLVQTVGPFINAAAASYLTASSSVPDIALSSVEGNPSVMDKQNKTMDDFLSTLSDLDQLIAAREESLTICSSPGNSAEDLVTDFQLQERCRKQLQEIEELEECIKREENAIISITLNDTLQAAGDVPHDQASEVSQLRATVNELDELTTRALERNVAIGKQVDMDIQQLLSLLCVGKSPSCSCEASLLSSLCSAHAKCQQLSNEWSQRSELLKELPAWRLNKMTETPFRFKTCEPKQQEAGGGEEGKDSPHLSSRGLEHLLSAATRCDEVCVRDSITKRGADFRSTFRNILLAGGVADSTCVEDSILCLESKQRIGSRVDFPYTSEATNNENGENEVDSLCAELTRLVKKNKECEDISNSDGIGHDGGEYGLHMTQAAASVTEALKRREINDSKTRIVLDTLDESHRSLAAAEQTLVWALRDKYESYTAAPQLVHALEGYPRRTSCDGHSQQGEAGGDTWECGGTMYGGRRLDSMSLLDMLNDFRESNGMPLLSS